MGAMASAIVAGRAVVTSFMRLLRPGPARAILKPPSPLDDADIGRGSARLPLTQIADDVSGCRPALTSLIKADGAQIWPGVQKPHCKASCR